MKKEITKAEYLQIVGLLTLAKIHNGKLQDITNAVDELIGDEENSHVSDAVYGYPDYDADVMLKKLEIKAED